ncbi:hypothetical protein ES703_69084 [subsurface metagenome]
MTQNLYDIIKLIDIDPSPTLFCEIFPIDELMCIIRFADREANLMIYYKIEEFKVIQYGIIMWHGLLAHIPPSYALCDGDNGTPDLRDKFVVGTANGVDPGGGGGAVNHNHTFTGDGHSHVLTAGAVLAAGADANVITSEIPAIGTTDNEDGRPPFYEIAYIMKL